MNLWWHDKHFAQPLPDDWHTYACESPEFRLGFARLSEKATDRERRLAEKVRNDFTAQNRASSYAESADVDSVWDALNMEGYLLGGVWGFTSLTRAAAYLWILCGGVP